MSKYRFIITVASVDRVVYPTGVNGLKYEWVTQEGALFKRKKLGGDLTFINDRQNSISDFDFFFAQEQSDQCAPILIRIEKLCSSIWTVDWNGKFSTSDGKFDINKCTFTVKPEVVDKYSCLIDYIKKDVAFNILETVQRRNVDSTFGKVQILIHEKYEVKYPMPTGWVIEEEYCKTYDGYTWSTDDCSTTDFGVWCEFSLDKDSGINQDGLQFRRKKTVYKREFIETVCSVFGCTYPTGGDGWTQLVDDCAGSGKCSWWRCTDGDYQYDNCVRLDEAIQAMLEAAACDVNSFRSIWMNYNPNVLDPVYVSETSGGTLNYVTGAATKTNHLLISQKSDIKHPTYDNAWKAEWTLSQMLADMAAMFEVYWDIDADGYFILEHKKYYSRSASSMVVNSASPYYEYFKAAESYEHTNLEIPYKETFKWMDVLEGTESLPDFFKGHPILYDEECSNPDRTVEVTVSDITTDLNFIAMFPDAISDDGFVMLHTIFVGGSYYLDSDGGRMNGHLSWTKLHENYLKWNRFLKSGTMNEVPNTTFYAAKANVRQAVINIPLCCGDEFNAYDSFATILGVDYLGEVGIVDKAEYSLSTEILKLTLSYSY